MRVEKDSFGKVSVPIDAYYGAFSKRAQDNFKISGITYPKEFIAAYAILKRSAAAANAELGLLDNDKKSAIVKACEDVIKGRFSDQFIVDVFQAGAGTSTNMNLNEVIANRALEIMHHKKGNYSIINPNDHVNMSQSTNDTFQSAAHIAAYAALKTRLVPALKNYDSAMAKKSREFSRIVKVGRTHLMDAVPITLGQEFSGYMLDDDMDALEYSMKRLLKLSVGGTAVGTGINVHKDFQKAFFRNLNKYTKYAFSPVGNEFSMTQNLSVILQVSSVLANIAAKLGKVANDLRLMSSGPMTGIAEIILPEVQPGSSIMPGKINPSMPEMMNMVCFQIAGNELAVRLAAQSGQFELNVFGPAAVYNMLQSIELLSNAVSTLSSRCILGIKPNKKNIEKHLDDSAAIATALSPFIGYAKTAELVKEALEKGISVRDLAIKKKLLSKEKVEKILDPQKLTSPNLPIEK